MIETERVTSGNWLSTEVRAVINSCDYFYESGSERAREFNFTRRLRGDRFFPRFHMRVSNFGGFAFDFHLDVRERVSIHACEENLEELERISKCLETLKEGANNDQVDAVKRGVVHLLMFGVAERVPPQEYSFQRQILWGKDRSTRRKRKSHKNVPPPKIDFEDY
ncbi:MAG: hypothetical protein NUV69_01670 [Candidatus Curtissbacteria bacterium]|nr:hypothetical protein [Candidatus Curtissbacteria bacterium]